MMMKKHAACAFVLIGAAFAAHAQAASTLTRTQVRQELVELQAAGYRTSLASSPDFPRNMQAVMQRAAQARGEGDAAGYGGDGQTHAESAGPALPRAADRGTYAHH
ncbi:DUF4148 domain-containing protein [Burkholderia sp. MSMB1826]|uniref:DUF4148 domain-containing protein n=1 Tax=Burkholderia sp. MSMB1826 TaxID=1637875 RepID=UPI00075EFCCE|nr:DUF4148 domain-containing protein [Burkholderia sp. MSMB1826]KVL15955.1 hypothetical protein WS95_18840 [Burkholderia sp. MSMB1826]